MILYQETMEYHQGYDDGELGIYNNEYILDTEEWDRYLVGYEDAENGRPRGYADKLDDLETSDA